MKKLLLIAILMLALVFTVVACTETPAGTDTTAADTTAETPTEAPTEEATTEAPTEEEPTEEVTTEAPTEEVTTEEPTEAPTAAPTEPETTEAPTADPADPVWIADPDAIAGTTSGAAAAYIAGAEVMEEDGYKFVRITVNGGDSQFMVARDLGTMPNYLVISYRVNSDLDGEMFIGTANGPNGQNDHASLDWNNDNTWSLMIVDLSTIANVADGNIGYFRLDPFRNTTDGNIDIEYIALFNTVEYAMAYDFELHPPYIEAADAAAGKVGHSFDTFYVNGSMYFEADGGAGDKLTAINNTITFDVGEAHESLALRGWIGFGQAIDQFGYFIDDPRAQVFDEFKQATEAGVLAAGGENASRFQINVPLTDLEGVHTIGFVVKLEDGTVVRLRENLTVVVVPYHEDKAILLGDRGNGVTPICSPNEKKVGQKINVTEGFLKQITVTEMATYGDNSENTWTFKVWQWNGDYDTTVAAAPLYEISGENHQDCHSMIIDIPATLMLSGEIYYEAEYLSGIGGFTGWIAEGYAAEGPVSYIAGVQVAVNFASSIRVGVPTPEGATKTVIDLSAVTSSGSYPTVDNPIPGSLFGAAHCYALHYGSINLGEMDLSKYSKVTITYSTPDDATVPTASAEYNMTGKRVLLLNAPSAAEGTFEYLPEESAIITSTQYELSPASLIPTTVEIDLTEITYNGDVYLTFDFRNPNNEIAVNAYVIWVLDITFS